MILSFMKSSCYVKISLMKTKVFSGIKPSGDMTLGNYLGMLKPAMDAQKGKENIFCIVDLHAITTPQEPKSLKKRTIDVAKLYLAAGLDLRVSSLFVQSHVSAHSELGWVLNCFTYFGEASRMTQFKDKHGMKGENVTVGLFDYPVLMAADILLYDTNEVPVGDDQRQHVELCRDIAIRVNNKYGRVFTVPSVVTQKEGARIMSLTKPEEKMSKSDDDANGYVLILDKPEVIRAKFARAVTDSGSDIKYDPKKKPGISNLLNILSVCTGVSIPTLEKKYIGLNYGQFKKDVADSVISTLKPVQEKYYSLKDTDVIKILRDGAKKVTPIAEKTLTRVKTSVGLG
jgi:tryptophanyl-tRNA synthetase